MSHGGLGGRGSGGPGRAAAVLPPPALPDFSGNLAVPVSEDRGMMTGSTMASPVANLVLPSLDHRKPKPIPQYHSYSIIFFDSICYLSDCLQLYCVHNITQLPSVQRAVHLRFDTKLFWRLWDSIHDPRPSAHHIQPHRPAFIAFLLPLQVLQCNRCSSMLINLYIQPLLK